MQAHSPGAEVASGSTAAGETAKRRINSGRECISVWAGLYKPIIRLDGAPFLMS